MSVVYRLLHPTPLGEFSITARGEDPVGSPVFVHGDATAPIPSEIDVNVDIDARKFDKARPDYLHTTWGIPLFSTNFVEHASPEFLDEVELIPARLHLRGGQSAYFAARTKKYLPLVDTEASKFSVIRGIKILTKPTFKTPEQSFHIARDAEFKRVLVASESMVAMIRERKLRVEYLPY